MEVPKDKPAAVFLDRTSRTTRGKSHSPSTIMAGDDGELPILSSKNDDIIVEILSWLPVVSLLQFRCVCKSWRALITTPQFVAKHRAHANDNNKNVLILTKPDWPPPYPPLPSGSPLLIDYQSLKENVAACASASSSAIRNIEAEFPDDTTLNDSLLVGSCNGLICLQLKPPPEYYYYDKYYEKIRLLLWNPSTRTARYGRAKVGTIGNRLCFHTFCYDSKNLPDREDTGLTIWVMMEYGVDQSWTIFAKIRHPSNVLWLNPLFLDDGALLMESNQCDLVLYMPKEDTCKIVLDNADVEELRPSSSSGYAEMVAYVGTLVSPVTGGG
ncbi:hypothetical protein DVH24_033500 [Malus domestica]|uniref:F-box domain-containing protein n=1 Tax=Malus domestica TaxID=3750 RepID=A0A498JEZ1_MALDO|nr:hypothetical protein DVH24_033500 [Malus domestica]